MHVIICYMRSVRIFMQLVCSYHLLVLEHSISQAIDCDENAVLWSSLTMNETNQFGHW